MILAAIAPLLWAVGGLVALALVRRERHPARSDSPSAATLRPAA